jgi:hypothetical protein
VGQNSIQWNCFETFREKRVTLKIMIRHPAADGKTFPECLQSKQEEEEEMKNLLKLKGEKEMRGGGRLPTPVWSVNWKQKRN